MKEEERQAHLKDVELANEQFKKYDKNHSGYLELDEVMVVMNEIFEKLGYKQKLTRGEVLAIMKDTDVNSD